MCVTNWQQAARKLLAAISARRTWGKKMLKPITVDCAGVRRLASSLESGSKTGGHKQLNAASDLMPAGPVPSLALEAA